MAVYCGFIIGGKVKYGESNSNQGSQVHPDMPLKNQPQTKLYSKIVTPIKRKENCKMKETCQKGQYSSKFGSSAFNGQTAKDGKKFVSGKGYGPELCAMSSGLTF